MASGSNFISLPDSNQYDGVSGRSVSTDANSIPSGGTVINGVRFYGKFLNNLAKELGRLYWN